MHHDPAGRKKLWNTSLVSAMICPGGHTDSGHHGRILLSLSNIWQPQVRAQMKTSAGQHSGRIMADDAEVQQAAKRRAEPADKSVSKDRAGLPSGADMRGEEVLASHEAEHWILKRWRPLMFFIIFVIALVVGFYYKSQAAPGTETLKHKTMPPQTINVYVSNSASVQVEVEISPNSSGQYTAEALTFIVKSAALHPHLKILITSSLQSGSFSRLLSARRAPHRQRYYEELAMERARRRLLINPITGDYTFYAQFHLPNVLQESRGTIFGHLPAVEIADGGPTGYLLAQMTKRGSIRYVIYNPQSSESTAPGALPPNISPHGGPMKWFYSPVSLSISESISDILPLLRGDQITYMTPPAKLQQANYTWQSNGELEPSFEATDPGAADARSNASFTSGIAFGVAGAAAIALVQELPREIRRRGRSRHG